MFLDARQLDDASDLSYDVCIAGAGAAGIALAVEFAGGRQRVCVLESGGFEPDEAVQSLYEGQSIGMAEFPLTASRLRFFGGSTNHWAGWCIPFDPLSFQERPWIPHSGWPIGWADVAPYYNRTRELLGLPGTGWDPRGVKWRVSDIRPGHPALPLDAGPFEDDTLCIQAVRMGEVFRDRLRSAGNVEVYLNANLVDIALNPEGTRVDRYRLGTLAGKSFTVRAKRYVLALGGIENARLLLASNSVQTRGVGNRNDLVGRFFADHVNVGIGYWVPSDPAIDIELYKPVALENARAHAFHKVAAEDQAAHRLTGAFVTMDPDYAGKSPGVRAASRIGAAMGRGRLPDDLADLLTDLAIDVGPVAKRTARTLWFGRVPAWRVDLKITVAPAPNPDSRIVLAEETDALGMPRVILDWRLSEVDYRTIEWTAQALAATLGASGLGRCRFFTEDRPVLELVEPAWHHMCTTRMADDPKQGVVDRDCRVHGVPNLSIAGSSVFPTPGQGTPTMFIVALAQRLADTLKEELGA